jgi:hypothetical protein
MKCVTQCCLWWWLLKQILSHSACKISCILCCDSCLMNLYPDSVCAWGYCGILQYVPLLWVLFCANFVSPKPPNLEKVAHLGSKYKCFVVIGNFSVVISYCNFHIFDNARMVMKYNMGNSWASVMTLECLQMSLIEHDQFAAKITLGVWWYCIHSTK